MPKSRLARPDKNVSTGQQHRSGYRLNRIYVAEQAYKIVADKDLRDVKNPSDRMVGFGWDWRPTGPRQFEVVIQIEIEPIRIAPEQMLLRLIGMFTAEETVSIPLPTFLKVNGPAILFPYAREVISTMSARGPHGAFHLNPVNVAGLLDEFDLAATNGSKYLDANPSVADDFGLAYKASREDSITVPVSG
jgi:preprotein translocase subunit SecB